MKQVKNPLSQLLGATLQKMRKSQIVIVDAVCKEIVLTPSAYRMIESGNANLNPNKAAALVRINCFQEIRFEKLSKFLVAIQILETFRDSLEELIKGLSFLENTDEEFKYLFAQTRLYSLIRMTERVPYIESIVVAVTKFLTTPFLPEYSELNTELTDLMENVPFIYNELLQESVDIITDKLKTLEGISLVSSEIKHLKNKIEKLKKLEVGLITTDLIEFLKGRTLIEISGAFYDFENLKDKEVIKTFIGNFKRLWRNEFHNIKYLIISNDTSKIKKVMNDLKIILKEYYTDSIQDTAELDFEAGFSKILWKSILPSDEVLYLLGINSKDKELWFYKEKTDSASKPQNAFGMFTTKVEDVFQETKVYKFTPLTNIENKGKKEIFDNIWNSK